MHAEVQTVFCVYNVDGGGMGIQQALLCVRKSRKGAETYAKSLNHAFYDVVEEQAVVVSGTGPGENQEQVFLIKKGPLKFGITPEGNPYKRGG